MRRGLSFDIPAELIDAIVERVIERLHDEDTRLASSASPFLSVEEAADFLRCSRQRIYDLLSSRRITKHRDGRRILLSRSELETYVSAGS